MERIDIFQLTNDLDLKNLANLSKPPIIFSNKESPPYYTITSGSSIIPDTGCSGHYVMTYYVMSSTSVHEIQSSTPVIAVTLLDGNKIPSSHTENLNITGLPSESSQYQISPELASNSLLSIGLLCDH